jgi:aspartate/methionine/tyrosine aminotransferase
MLKARANVNIVVAQPPTYDNWDNYLVPSLQAVYDFSAEKSRIKAVLLCNPHNPLSRCYPKKALLELMEFCQEHSLHLIVDEIYAQTDLTIIPEKAPPFVSALSLTEPLIPEGAIKVDPSRVHVVWSASKLFGMSGFRVVRSNPNANIDPLSSSYLPICMQGCIISQQNAPLLSALSLLTTSHVNNIASLYLTTLLTWSQLPTLLKLNSERLTASYYLLAAFLSKWHIDFVPPSHGLFLWAKLAKGAKCAEDEKTLFEQLALDGVKVGEGRGFKGVKGDYGWARIRFSVSGEVMREALARMDKVLSRRGAD